MTKHKSTIALVFLIINSALSIDYDSVENKIDNQGDSTVYDTIIFNDITDVLSELSNDDVEEEIKTDPKNFSQLLAEYQKYVKKAANKRKILEKTTNRNKISNVRRDNSLSTNALVYKYPESFYHTPDTTQNKQSGYVLENFYVNPTDLLLPYGQKYEIPFSFEQKTAPKINKNENAKTMRSFFDKETRYPVTRSDNYKKNVLDPSNCYCNDFAPCNCGCSKCYYYTPHYESKSQSDPNLYAKPYTGAYDTAVDSMFPYEALLKSFQLYFLQPEGPVKDTKENQEKTLNLNVKVEIQMPGNKEKENKTTTVVETRNICNKLFSFPMPYFNMPDFKKNEKPKKHDITVHKVTIHKKKKSKTNNDTQNKKNKKKPNQVGESTDDVFKSSAVINHQEQAFQVKPKQNDSLNDSLEFENFFKNFVVYSTELPIDNTTGTISAQQTTTIQKQNNEIKVKNALPAKVKEDLQFNITEETTTTEQYRNKSKSRSRRHSDNQSGPFKFTLSNKKVPKQFSVYKSKANKTDDGSLLIWPESKDKKAINIKLSNSMSNRFPKLIRETYNDSLARSSFGKIDWKELDSVAPLLISFMGKYLNGVLTYCSNKLCHSIKCEQQQCIYRVCRSDFNNENKGHCLGSKDRDMSVKVESKTDPQPKLMFDALDIVKKKLMGNLYGKATLCVRSKCMTIVATKKKSFTTHCNMKEIVSGHCTINITARNL